MMMWFVVVGCDCWILWCDLCSMFGVIVRVCDACVVVDVCCDNAVVCLFVFELVLMVCC